MEDNELRSDSPRRNRRASGLDLAHAGQKDENIAAGLRGSLDHSIRDSCSWPVDDLHRMKSAAPLDRCTFRLPAEISLNGLRIDRRRHHDDPQIVTSLRCLPQHRQSQIRIDRALMELIEYHCPEPAEQRVRLQTCRQNALGADQ